MIINRELLDALTAKYTAFGTFEQFTSADYSPTLRVSSKGINGIELRQLADCFDVMMGLIGKTHRAYRV